MSISIDSRDPFEELKEIHEFARRSVSSGIFSRFCVFVTSGSSAVITPLVNLVDGISKRIFGMAPITAILDTVLPLDRFSGRRGFFLPSFFDRFLGLWAFLNQETHDFELYTRHLDEPIQIKFSTKCRLNRG